MTRYQIISADSHINEPPDLFTHVPNALRDVAPKLVKTEKGDAWIMGPGAEPRLVSSSAVAGRKKEEYLAKPVTYEEMRKGSFLPGPRLEDMDIDHIDGDVMYPGIMRYTERCANAEIRLACCDAYNEWMADFCAFKPERLVGIAVLPPIDDMGGEAAIKALERARKFGLRTAYLTQVESGVPVHHPSADKFWAIAADLEMPISLHIMTNPFYTSMTKENRKLPGSLELLAATVDIAMAEHLVLLTFGGVFMRHPKLKIVLAEGGIGWIPAVLQRMDHTFKVHRPYMGSPIKELPSETFAKHCYATFQNDRAGVRLRDAMGAGNLMWASDYPHTDTTWPESADVIETIFEGVPEADKRKMVCDNAARLYGFTN